MATEEQVCQMLEPKISKLCYKFHKSLSKYGSLISEEDLRQECFLAIVLAYREGKYDSEKSGVETYFYRRAVWHLTNIFNSLLYTKKRGGGVEVEDSDVEDVCELELGYRGTLLAKSCHSNCERDFMLKEFLECIGKSHAEFVDMIINGVPEELKLEERRLRRKRVKNRKRYSSSLVDSKVKYTKSLIESYFGINVQKLEKISREFLY